MGLELGRVLEENQKRRDRACGSHLNDVLTWLKTPSVERKAPVAKDHVSRPSSRSRTMNDPTRAGSASLGFPGRQSDSQQNLLQELSIANAHDARNPKGRRSGSSRSVHSSGSLRARETWSLRSGALRFDRRPILAR